MRPGSDWGPAAGLGVVAVLLAGAALFAHRNIRDLAGDAAAVARGYAVLDALHDLQATLADAEAAARGFLAAADPGLLGPHDRAAREVPAKLDRLAELTRDDPFHRARLPDLRAAADAKLAHARRAVEAARGGDPAAARQAVQGEGRRLADQVRLRLAGLEAEERRRLADRQRAADRYARSAVGAVAAAAALGLAAAGLVAVLVVRHRRHRDRAAADLHAQRELLRATLAGAGDGLIAADAAGRVTALNPAAEALTGWAQPDAAGRPLEEVARIVGATTRQPVENPARRVLKTGAAVGPAEQAVLVARDGRERAVAARAAPTRDRSGGVSGAVLVFREVPAGHSPDDLTTAR